MTRSSTRHAWISALVPALMISAAAGAAESASAVGFWVTQDHGAVVAIEPCSSGLCGHLVGLRTDRPPGEVSVDDRNPDAAKRNVPRCGLLLMGSMKPAGDTPGKWQDGWVYDPESGNTYSGTIRLEGPNTLRLRGYVGIPLLGRTEIWTRESGDAKNRCTPPAHG